MPIVLNGSTSGSITLTAPAVAGSSVITFPTASTNLVGDASVQTLTNKTLTGPVINGFTGDTSIINIGSGQIYKDTSGRVGIGTSATTSWSSAKLSVLGTSVGNAATPMSIVTPGSNQGEKSAITLFSTFQGTLDNSPRRTADIVAGFNGGAWGTEYLAFNVGLDGASNDAQNLTTERMRVSQSGITVTPNVTCGNVIVTGTVNTSNVVATSTVIGTALAIGSSKLVTTAAGRTGVNVSAPVATLDVSGNQTFNVVTPGAFDIDCSSGVYFSKTITTSSTFTFSNVPAGRAYSFTLEVNAPVGSYTITWPAAVVWPNGLAPAYSTSAASHLFVFVTDDGGSRWRGAALTNYTT